MTKVEKISHVGIAVHNVNQAVKLLEDCFGAELMSKTEIDIQKQISALISIGDSMLELMEPTGEGTVAKFLNEKGEGLHHISLKVDNVSELANELEAKGIRIVGKIPPDKPVFAFIHPKSMHGVLVELTEM
jgi:methylmalonyl-CoA epimerase